MHHYDPFSAATNGQTYFICLPSTKNVKETTIVAWWQVLFVQCCGNHVCKVGAQPIPFVARYENFSICEDLCYYINLLPAKFFMRIHRSYLVNINMIIAYNKTERRITMADGTQFTIACDHLPEFKKLLPRS